MNNNSNKNNVEQLIKKYNSGWERMFPDSDVEEIFMKEYL